MVNGLVFLITLFELSLLCIEIQQIIRDYYKQLYANKMDNLEEIDKFLERYNFPRLNQEEIENMNKPITSCAIETVIKRLQKKNKKTKIPGPASFVDVFYQTFREDLTCFFLNYSKKL